MSLNHVAQGGAHVAAHNDERDAINELTEKLATTVDSSTIRHIVRLSQAEYNAIATPATDTLYVVL